MNNGYRRFMEQQCLSHQTKQSIYCNLQKTKSYKPGCVFLKAAAILLCVILLIPVSVLAAQNIFGIAVFNRVENASIQNRPGVGYEVRFETIKGYPITDFSEHLQGLEKTTVVCFDSWEDAQEDLGIDLIANNVCQDEETQKILLYVAEGTPQTSHCEGVYSVVDGRLASSRISAVYQYRRVKFIVSAYLTVEHLTATDQNRNFKHVYFQEDTPSFTTNQYTTKNGIPMTVSVVHAESLSEDQTGYTDYTVYFAVNDIVYTVSIVGCEGVWEDAHIYAVLCEILEGFTF